MFQAAARLSAVLMLLAAMCCWYTRCVYAQIAPGVMQSAARTATLSGSVVNASGVAVIGAAVRLQGPSVFNTKTDEHGTFAFASVPWGTYQITVISSLGTVARSLNVNADADVSIQYEPQSSLQTIAHVSTNGVGAHINVTSSSVASVSPSDYAFQGNTSWAELLAQIPGVAASGNTLGGGSSFVAFAGAPQTPVILSLNGALPYETSTTLDGMPLEGTSATQESESVGGGTDLSTLPLDAFDAADVVRGPGANAPSIVDSIGGSFVLHPAGAVASNHFELSVSNDPYGGIVSNAKVALRFGRLSATVVYGVDDSPGPLGYAAKIFPAISLTPNTINGEPVWGSTFSYVTPTHGFNCYCMLSNTLLFCCEPFNTGWNAHSGAASLSYQVSPSITASVFYSGSTSTQNEPNPYYLTNFAPSSTAPPYTGNIEPSPNGQTNYSFLNSTVPFFSTQASSLLEEKITAYVGPGVLRLAALQHNSYQSRDTNFSYNSGEYTLWGTASIGPASPGVPTTFNESSADLTFVPCLYKSFVRSNNRDLLGSYAIQLGLNSSAGVSYLTSYYNEPYSTELSYDGVPFYSSSLPSALSATTNETRVHIDSQLTRNLSAGLSWYFANASYHIPRPGVSNTWTQAIFSDSAPRFGAVWRPASNVAIRAAAGGGFALPVLCDLTGFSLFQDGPAYYETSPNLNLKPERSFGYDVGTDVRFNRNEVVSFDLYRTNLFGQFFQATTVSTYKGLPLYLTQFGNVGTSVMEGINLDVHRDVASGIYWHATGGLTRGYVTDVPAGFYDNPGSGCTKCTNQEIILGPNFTSAAFSATVPYSNASALLGYRWNPNKYADISLTYYGNNNIYNVPAFVEANAHLGYPLTRNVALLMTFTNITGQHDAAIQTLIPSSLVSAISGVAPLSAAYGVPFGPRAITLTLNFNDL